MVGLAGSRYALESDGPYSPVIELSNLTIEETPEVPQDEPKESEHSLQSDSRSIEEQRQTDPVEPTRLESQSENNPSELQSSFPGQVKLPATARLVGSRRGSVPTASAPQKKRQARKRRDIRQYSNQALYEQSMADYAANKEQSSDDPRSNTWTGIHPSAAMVQQLGEPNVQAEEFSNSFLPSSNTSPAAPAQPSWPTDTPGIIPEEYLEDDL